MLLHQAVPGFEAWFGSSADFDDQAGRGLVECPFCGSRAVEKAVMAPAVSGARKSAAAPEAARQMQTMMMEAARDQGFRQGFVVPFHYRDRLGAVHSSSTVFFWEDQPRDFDKLFICHRHELHLLMIYWVQRAMDIVNRDQRNAPSILKPADAAETIKLTGREKEVIAWAARGKTVADTAQILGISPETVEGFIKQALRKLEASNKTHGVAKSIALGIIDL